MDGWEEPGGMKRGNSAYESFCFLSRFSIQRKVGGSFSAGSLLQWKTMTDKRNEGRKCYYVKSFLKQERAPRHVYVCTCSVMWALGWWRWGPRNRMLNPWGMRTGWWHVCETHPSLFPLQHFLPLLSVSSTAAETEIARKIEGGATRMTETGDGDVRHRW